MAAERKKGKGFRETQFVAFPINCECQNGWNKWTSHFSFTECEGGKKDTRIPDVSVKDRWLKNDFSDKFSFPLQLGNGGQRE